MDIDYIDPSIEIDTHTFPLCYINSMTDDNFKKKEETEDKQFEN